MRVFHEPTKPVSPCSRRARYKVIWKAIIPAAALFDMAGESSVNFFLDSKKICTFTFIESMHKYMKKRCPQIAWCSRNRIYKCLKYAWCNIFENICNLMLRFNKCFKMIISSTNAIDWLEKIMSSNFLNFDSFFQSSSFEKNVPKRDLVLFWKILEKGPSSRVWGVAPALIQNSSF